MKVTEHIANAQGKTIFSFEILPPLKGQSIQSIFDGIDPLMEFNPQFIDVTYHREEYILKPRPNGSFDKIVTRKRPGTVAVAAAIKNRYKIDVVPHIICGGFSKEETENALIDLNFLGIDNILALRGDNVKSEPNWTTHPDGNQDAIELIAQIQHMNAGKYLDDDLTNADPSMFCIGVGGYPEKHFEAPNRKSDLSYLKRKIDAGADFIVTQMFFDNAKYFQFVDECRAAGINVPIIPGIKPIATKSHLTVLPKIFHIDIPEALADAVEQSKDNKAVQQIGIEWAIEQCQELKAAGVPVLHFYTMSKSAATKAIAKHLF